MESLQVGEEHAAAGRQNIEAARFALYDGEGANSGPLQAA
jgi:hypothetical protein